jgi:hypothetical protein
MTTKWIKFIDPQMVFANPPRQIYLDEKLPAPYQDFSYKTILPRWENVCHLSVQIKTTPA